MLCLTYIFIKKNYFKNIKIILLGLFCFLLLDPKIFASETIAKTDGYSSSLSPSQQATSIILTASTLSIASPPMLGSTKIISPWSSLSYRAGPWWWQALKPKFIALFALGYTTFITLDELQKRSSILAGTSLSNTQENLDPAMLLSTSLLPEAKETSTPPHTPKPLPPFFELDSDSEPALTHKEDLWEPKQYPQELQDLSTKWLYLPPSTTHSSSTNLALTKTNLKVKQEQWLKQMRLSYQNISSTYGPALAQKFHIDSEYSEQFLKIIHQYYRQHLNSPIHQAIFLGFVLDLSPISLAEFAQNNIMTLASCQQILDHLHHELATHLLPLPKQFSSKEELGYYQRNFFQQLRLWEDHLYSDYHGILEPLKSHHLIQLGQDPLQETHYHQDELLYLRTHVLGVPKITTDHLHQLLELKPYDIHKLSLKQLTYSQQPTQKPIAQHSYPDLHHKFFTLGPHQITNLYHRFSQHLPIEQLDEDSFYAELRSFFVYQLKHQLHRHLFLSFVIKILQPTAWDLEYIMASYDMPDHQHSKSPERNIDKTTTQKIRAQIILIMMELKKWFHQPHLSFSHHLGSKDDLREYFIHRYQELTEKDLEKMGRLWGALSPQRARQFPRKLHHFIHQYLNHPVNFNLFYAYVLNWNPLPISEFAEMHGRAPRDIIQLRHKYRSLFQQHLQKIPTTKKSLTAILTDFLELFDHLSDQEIEQMMKRLSLADRSPDQFRKITKSFLRKSAYDSPRLILFFAKTLEMSALSFLDWDLVFSHHLSSQLPFSSIHMHLKIQQNFNNWLSDY